MKQIYKVLAAAVVVAGATSCTDFLEPDPKGQMVTETFFQSENDLNMALNALYHQVQLAQGNSNPTIPQVQGDDITSGVGSNKSAYLSADAFATPSDYKGVEALWKRQYSIIQASNLIVDNAERVDASEEVINMGLGNALFWRACAYFQLVRVFGPLPVNMHNLPDNNSTPLTSVDGIYQLITEDLERADALNLPTSYEGRKYGFSGSCNYWVTQQAVKSALTAVYMNMAGYPMYKDDYYGKAADKAKEVVDGVKSGKYNLAIESDWKEVYNPGNDWSKEQVITIAYYNMPGAMNDWTSQFCKCHRFESLQNGWGDFIPEYRWWANFPAGPRKDCVYDPKINTYQKDNNGKTIYVDWWATYADQETGEERTCVSPRHPMFAPFTINADESGAPIREPHDYMKPAYDGQSFPQNHRFIRYSEVLCWYAESAARSGKHVSEAKTAFQAVLDRAYNAGQAPNAAAMSNDQLAKQAWLEHGYEVTGYPLALVTRRADQFRLNTFKEAWEYRRGNQTDVLVPAGTLTSGFERKNTNFGTNKRPNWKNFLTSYTLEEGLTLKEQQDVAPTWNGENSIYQAYPPTETEKNPLIVR